MQLFLWAGYLSASATVTVSIDETSTQPLQSGFSGYNAIFATGSSSMLDTNLQSITKTLMPRWFRYPGGTLSDAFEVNSGYLNLDWANQINNSFLVTAYYELLGRAGGAQIEDMNTFTKAVNAQGIVVCVNGFTDTANSIGTFAANAKANSYPVIVYELANEPYLFPNFFSSSTAYLEAMQPYSAAIKAADPTAKVSVFIKGVRNGTNSWQKGVNNFANPYWDYISIHDYPNLNSSEGTTISLIPSLNHALASIVNAITSTVKDYTNLTAPIIISEYAPGQPSNGFYGTLYGGIYVAEFALRVATLEQVIHIGPHALLGNNAGLDSVNNYNNAVYNAGQNIAANVPGAEPIDTTKSPYNFGYFASAQAAAYALASTAMANATDLAATSVTGGGNVANGKNNNLPAVHAQAFTDGTNTWLVVTNKSSTAQTMSIIDQVHAPGTAPLTVTTVTAEDPLTINTSSTTATNSSGQSVPVVAPVTTEVVNGNIPLPGYSVLLLTW